MKHRNTLLVGLLTVCISISFLLTCFLMLPAFDQNAMGMYCEYVPSEQVANWTSMGRPCNLRYNAVTDFLKTLGGLSVLFFILGFPLALLIKALFIKAEKPEKSDLDRQVDKVTKRLCDVIFMSMCSGMVVAYIIITLIFMTYNFSWLILAVIIGVILVVPVGTLLALPCIFAAWFYFNSLIRNDIWNVWRWIAGGTFIAVSYILILAVYFPSGFFVTLITFFGAPIGTYVGFNTWRIMKKEKYIGETVGTVHE